MRVCCSQRLRAVLFGWAGLFYNNCGVLSRAIRQSDVLGQGAGLETRGSIFSFCFFTLGLGIVAHRLGTVAAGFHRTPTAAAIAAHVDE
jgi:hypothetical protein